VVEPELHRGGMRAPAAWWWSRSVIAPRS